MTPVGNERGHFAMGRKFKVYDEEVINNIKELRLNNISYVNIGKQLGISHKKVKELCLENGVDHIDNRYAENNVNWVGGSRNVDANGYVNIYFPQTHPFYEEMKTRRHTIMEHRLVMAEHIGRPLMKHENVHHKNGDRQDNRIENLELWSKMQPAGQKISDKITWAIEFLGQYGDLTWESYHDEYVMG